jgi:tRNA-2-methylthio-N6-dimethylallyladenosine synthase
MAQREKGHIFKRAPHVDVVCGPSEIGEIDRYVRSVEEGADRVLATNLVREVSLEREVSTRPRRFQAFVNVQRGCDRACTFCIVPAVRGRQADRPLQDIVDEVRRLADDGCVEVTLLGQNIDAYGRRGDLGASLARLLREVARVPGLLRVRFVTSHPADMEEDLLRAMGELPIVCGYLHVPAQSGSDSVLKRMARGYTREGYLRQVELARRHVPRVEFASDFIVGFPGETDAEFEATADFVAEVGFQTTYVFKYSVRDGTHASRALPDDVPEAEKRARNQTLLAIQERVSLRRNRALVGGVAEVLVEGRSARDSNNMTGRTRGNQIVVFPAPESGSSASSLEGRLVTVALRDATPLTLLGNLVAASAP